MEIANELKCSQTNVRYWLRKLELSTNIKRYNKGNHKNTPPKCTTCGEADKTKFYGKKKRICGKCQNKYVIESGRKKKKKAVEHKGGKCKSCGYDKCVSALDFHHRDPATKDKNWSRMKGWSWDRLVKELDKCDLLCANCHRELHEELYIEKNDSIVISKIPKKKPKPLIEKRCKTCQKKFKTKDDKRKFCSMKCGNIFVRKVIRPSKNELQSIIDSGKPFTSIGKMFGVSDNAVRKWAKQYEII